MDSPKLSDSSQQRVRGNCFKARSKLKKAIVGHFENLPPKEWFRPNPQTAFRNLMPFFREFASRVFRAEAKEYASLELDEQGYTEVLNKIRGRVVDNIIPESAVSSKEFRKLESKLGLGAEDPASLNFYAAMVRLESRFPFSGVWEHTLRLCWKDFKARGTFPNDLNLSPNQLYWPLCYEFVLRDARDRSWMANRLHVHLRGELPDLIGTYLVQASHRPAESAEVASTPTDSECEEQLSETQSGDAQQSTPLTTAEERRKAVEQAIEDASSLGIKLTKTMIWKEVGHTNGTQFERWQGDRPGQTDKANAAFKRVLQNRPWLNQQ